jgi:hypothetical protein
MAWTTPSTWVAGAILTAAQLNTQLRDNLDAIGGAWTSYTPTWTNVTIGNATQNSAYIAAGKLYIVRTSIVFGSTTSLSGIPEITLPGGVSVRGSGAYEDTSIFGVGGFRSGAGNDYPAGIMRSGTTAARVRFLTYNTAGTYALYDTVSATIPFTWGNGARISGTFVFEAA